MKEREIYGILGYVKEQGLAGANNIGRIIKQTNNTYTIATLNGIIEQVKQKRTKKEKKKKQIKHDFVIGDYVRFEKIEEHYFLIDYFERKNVVSKADSQAKKSYRKQTTEQLMAANIDHVFITISADQRFTLSKLERYILTFSVPDATLDILITKADYKEQAHYLTKQIEASDLNYPVLKLSMHDGESIEALRDKMTAESTSIVLGASGAGKSTLINQLIGDSDERTGEVRSDGKGKHTTTYSSLVVLPNGSGYIVDTPGIKSIATTQKNHVNLFEDIVALSRECKFRDCKHQTEPGCAVKKAVEKDIISKQSLDRFKKYSTN